MLLLGTLDSSFLFMPLGNDLLVIALTAAHHTRMPYYVAMATAGSVLGVAFTHWGSVKGGEKAIEGDRKGRRILILITGRIRGKEPRATLEEVRMGRKKMFASSARAVQELGFQIKPVYPAMRAAIDWFRANGYAP